MIRTTLIRIVLLLTVAGLASTARADTNSGLPFLQVGPSAHSLAISQAHTAVNLGASSIYTNPAHLARSRETTVNGGYTRWLGNTNNSHAAINLPRENDSFAIGLLSSVIGDIEQRDQPGPATGTFNVNYLSIAGGYARQVGPISVGMTAMFLHELIYNTSASGYGLNFGATGSFWQDRVSIGAALLNTGSMQDLDMEPTPLPTTLNAGFDLGLIQFSVTETEEVPVVINLSSDFVQPINELPATENRPDIEEQDDWFINTGISVEIAEIITVNGGYRSGDTIRPISFGGSLTSGQLTFDYAFVPFETGFQSVHSVGISYRVE